MGTSYMPSREPEQVGWANNFDAGISANPVAAGLTIEQAAAFAAVNATLQAAWSRAQDPSTKTSITIADKNDALRAMKAMARNLVSIIQGTDTVTDGQKLALGLTVRDTSPTRIPAPDVAPFILVTGVAGRTATIELRQATATRGKPAGVTGATIFLYQGSEPPASADLWQFAATVTKTTFELPFPAGTTTDTYYLTAFWTNAKGQSGPSAEPAKVVLLPGGALPTAIDTTNSTLKIAA